MQEMAKLIVLSMEKMSSYLIWNKAKILWGFASLVARTEELSPIEISAFFWACEKAFKVLLLERHRLNGLYNKVEEAERSKVKIAIVQLDGATDVIHNAITSDEYFKNLYNK